MVESVYTVPLEIPQLHRLTGSSPMAVKLGPQTETSEQATTPMELQCLK